MNDGVNSELEANTRLCRVEIVIWGIAMSMLLVALAMLHPMDRPYWTVTQLPAAAAIGWVAFEAICIESPIVFGALFVTCWWPRAARWVGKLSLTSIVGLFAVDTLLFHWHGMHLLDGQTVAAIWNVAPVGWRYASFGFGLAWGTGVVISVCLLVISWRVNRYVCGLLMRTEPLFSHLHLLAMTFAILLFSGGLVGISQWQHVSQDMLAHPSRHPWVMFRWFERKSPTSDGVKDTETGASNRLMVQSTSLDSIVQRRVHQMRFNVIAGSRNVTEKDDRGGQHPDIVVVVCESFRPELLSEHIMPNVYAVAQRGLSLTNHFSGGNASSLGMFSLFNGLEAIWFYKSEVRFSPAITRIFRQAGYEVGFYGGHDDWAFQMDAFIHSKHFDRFHIEPLDWGNSDRRTIEHAARFLDSKTPGKPKLAIVFLYETHSPFGVDPRFDDDPNAASSFYPIPFPPSQRESVWNRYVNSARTLDSQLDPILSGDQIILITGDHGESFLDDGTIGHGTKLSQVQLQTPAILAGPGIAKQRIDAITTHCDLLPTLLTTAGLHVTKPDLFDGLDLLHHDEILLAQRVVSASHYLRHEIVLLGPWTANPTQPFGFHTNCSLMHNRFAPISASDMKGKIWQPLRARPVSLMNEACVKWLTNFER